MSDSSDACDATIADCLRRHAESVEPAGRDRWRFKLGGPSGLEATARLDQDWLLVEAGLARRRSAKALRAQRLERMLQYNAGLEGGAKFSLGEDPRRVFLSAELPLEAEIRLEGEGKLDLPRRLAQMCVGFRRAAGLFATGKARRDTNRRALATAGDHGSSVEKTDVNTLEEKETDGQLATLSKQAGWSCHERSGGRIAVPLDVRDAFCQAVLESSPEGTRRLRVDLGRIESDSPASRQAVPLLLLSACRVVRMARASARRSNGALEHQWEVALSDGAGAEELGHALSALSVACQLTAREVRALEDETIARDYLAVRGITL